MTAGYGLRIAALALALGIAAAPLGAQNAVVPANSSETVVGPPQLQDFSLDGTVTRRAEPPPAQQQPPQSQTSERVRPALAESADATPLRQQAVQQQPTRQPTRDGAQASSAAEPTATSLASGQLFDLPPPTQAQPTGFTPSLPAEVPAAETTDDGSSGLLSMPWLLALLAAAGAAAWYFLRQRPRLAYAGGAAELSERQADPQTRPEPLKRSPMPTPAPAPAPALPQGIVSTRLRPWLDIAVAPHSCRLSDDGATVEFDVTLVNSGSAPARDVQVEAAMINADPAQDEQINGYFARPAGKGEPIAAIAPLKSVTLRSAVTMPRDQLRLFEVDGRKLFVPLIAFNALYRHSAGGGQTSAAFLLGRDGKGEKMAPFLFDQAPRQFSGLAARELEPRVRS
jgi:hypothetical protein